MAYTQAQLNQFYAQFTPEETAYIKANIPVESIANKTAKQIKSEIQPKMAGRAELLKSTEKRQMVAGSINRITPGYEQWTQPAKTGLANTIQAAMDEAGIPYTPENVDKFYAGVKDDPQWQQAVSDVTNDVRKARHADFRKKLWTIPALMAVLVVLPSVMFGTGITTAATAEAGGVAGGGTAAAGTAAGVPMTATETAATATAAAAKTAAAKLAKMGWDELVKQGKEGLVSAGAEYAFGGKERRQATAGYKETTGDIGQWAGIQRGRAEEDYALQQELLGRSQQIQDLTTKEKLLERGILPSAESSIAGSEWERLREQQESEKGMLELEKRRKLEDVGIAEQRGTREAKQEYEQKYQTFGDILQERIKPTIPGISEKIISSIW